MATDVKDVGQTIGSALGKIAREAAQGMSSNGRSSSLEKANGSLSGARGVAAGAALAAVPFAARAGGKAVKRVVSKGLPGSDDSDAGIGEKLKEGVKGTVGSKVAEGVGDKMKQEGAKGKKGTPGVGKGRRMPVQQAVDIAVPISTVYNQWTQFEEWPQFMHRLDQATQDDDCTVSFRTKIWGMSREFEAQIVEQRPDERIAWTVTNGVTHNGVVTFHELADRLTRVQVTLDVEPGSLLEKVARGMRHVKRAVRADLARFKAFIEMQEVETGAWRGVIHDGELAKKHDKKYDRGRDYAEFDDIHDTEHSHSPPSSGRSTSTRRPSSGQRKSGQRKSSGQQKSRSSSASSRGRSSSSSRGGNRSNGRSGSSRTRSQSSNGRSGSSSRSSRSRSSSRS